MWQNKHERLGTQFSEAGVGIQINVETGPPQVYCVDCSRRWSFSMASLKWHAPGTQLAISHLLFLKSKLFSWMVLSFQENWVESIESFQIPSPPISLIIIQFSSVQSLSHVWLFVTPSTAALQASLSITNSRSLLKLMPIESVMPSNHLILCCPSPPALNLM